MSPEAQLIAVNIVLLGYAYFWAYPRLTDQSALRIMRRDVVVTVTALMIGALLFAGTETVFDLKVIKTDWFVFQLVIMVMIETPLFLWYAHTNDLEF